MKTRLIMIFILKTSFTTVLVIAGNLAADLLYSVLDPRIRKEA